MRLLSSLLAAVSLAAVALAEPTVPMIIAHRGASAYAPENTVASARLGWEMGAEAVEIDVHLTADNRVVVIHDETTKRTANGNLVIQQSTAEAIAALDAGSWKGPQFAGEPIPFLEDVLAAMPEGRKLVIEIKVGPEAVPPIAELVNGSGRRADCIIIAFNKDTCVAARAAFPEMPVYWLIGTPKNEQTGEYPPIPPARAAEAHKAGFTGLNVSRKGVDAALVAACRAEGIPLLTWTVDDPAEARHLVELGVTAITTNKPDVMLAEFPRK